MGERSYKWGIEEGRRRRDEALDRLEKAHEIWLEIAESIIHWLAITKQEFTTDQVWSRLERRGEEGIPREPRALGALMTRAKRQGVIRPTDRTVLSCRPQCHCRPIRVWRSNVFEK
jgi:hypothetical protein